MAKVILNRGTTENLTQEPLKDGNLSFTIDDGRVHIDYVNENNELVRQTLYSGKLTFGPHEYNATEDVNVEIYEGQYNCNLSEGQVDLSIFEEKLNNTKAKVNAILNGDNIVVNESLEVTKQTVTGDSAHPTSYDIVKSEIASNQIGKKYYFDEETYIADIFFSDDKVTWQHTNFTNVILSPFTVETWGITAKYIQVALRKKDFSAITESDNPEIRIEYTQPNNIVYQEDLEALRNELTISGGSTNDNNNVYVVKNGGSILESVQYCYSHGIKKLIIEAGDYDIIQEYKDKYGANYFDTYSDNSPAYNGLKNKTLITSGVEAWWDAGIWLYDIEVIFKPGATVTANYTGSNRNVHLGFSAFAISNNVTIDGLVLDAKNIRYGIHPDFAIGFDVSTFILKNCNLHHYNTTTVNPNNQCLGCGLGNHSVWIFDNCIFRSDANLPVIRVHNADNLALNEAKSSISITNCYFDGPGYAQFNHCGPTQEITDILVNKCSYINAPQVGYERPEIDIYPNMNLISWNNQQR